ncbi:MAG: pitrilysin family protein [bacterium]
MLKKTVLPNNIRIISEYMQEAYSSTIMVWLDAGSGLESMELNGISHFIEHMLFKGTKCRSPKQIVEAIENTGGSINAFTDRESTCCYAKVLSSHVTVAVDILLDMVLNSLYDEKDVKLEKQVILEEIKMYEDTPDELVYDLLLKSFLGEHPLGQSVIGTAESIFRISKKDILDFVNDFYTSDNIVISIAGNFNEEAVLSQINDTIGHIKTCAKSKKTETPVISPKISVINKKIEQSHICLGTRGISILDKDRYALDIIDVCLGGSMGSRLFQEVREKRGLAYSINTYAALYRPCGIFGVYLSANPANVKEVINLTLKEIEKFRLTGLSDEEIQKAKNQIKGNMFIGLESTKHRACRNAMSELYFNKVLTIEEISARIDEITQDDIIRLSNYIFDNKYMGIALVGPKESGLAIKQEFVL